MKKYAVFRSPTGLYCYEYIDTMEKLAKTDFADFVTEEQLPIVLDGNGGYFNFDNGDYCFLKVIESDKECPLKLEEMYYKNDPDFKLGWMSPDGDTYSCSYTNHNKCAIMLAKKFFPKSKYPETALGRGGWLKIIDSWDGRERQHGQYVHSDSGRITNKQINRLFDLGLYDNEEVQRLIKDNNGDW
ncbi:MAG: hypothetical protein J6I47_01415 [Ruminococcus sp.]|nr:hypothetical protein [Ruminococcus sp.]